MGPDNILGGPNRARRSNMTVAWCVDVWLGDNCPGCALRQMEAHVDMHHNSRMQGPAVLELER